MPHARVETMTAIVSTRLILKRITPDRDRSHAPSRKQTRIHRSYRVRRTTLANSFRGIYIYICQAGTPHRGKE